MKTPVVLLSAPVLLVLWRYHGVVKDRHGSLEGCYFQFIFFFAIAGVLPALYSRASGVRLAELGLGAGDARFGARRSQSVFPGGTRAAQSGHLWRLARIRGAQGDPR